MVTESVSPGMGRPRKSMPEMVMELVGAARGRLRLQVVTLDQVTG